MNRNAPSGSAGVLERWLLPLVIWSLSLVVIAFGVQGWLPELASEQGAGIDRMLYYLLFSVGSLFVIGNVLLGYFIWRFSRAEKVTFRNATHMRFTYDFDSDAAAGVQNNGNVGSMVDQVEGITYSYTYDYLNRLKTADAAGGTDPWGYSYSYDDWGNLLERELTLGTGLPMGPITMTSKNHIDTAVHTDYDYDATGNMTGSPDISASYVYKYDAENRLINVKLGATVLGLYTYDGDTSARLPKAGKLSAGSNRAVKVIRKELFVAEGDHRINPDCAARRNKTGQRGHDNHQK